MEAASRRCGSDGSVEYVHSFVYRVVCRSVLVDCR